MGDLVLFSGGMDFFSHQTPSQLRYLLHTAQTQCLSSGEPRAVEQLLLKARTQWPKEADAHLTLYKFYFIAARYCEAEAAAWLALKQAAEQGGFNRNYRRLSAASADWQALEGASRWYLFTLKALGVIRLRRGKVQMAKRVLNKLLELDPSDQIGGGAYLCIAETFD